MCNTSLHHRGFGNPVDTFPFSTFHLLRTCNRLMIPPNPGPNPPPTLLVQQPVILRAAASSSQSFSPTSSSPQSLPTAAAAALTTTTTVSTSKPPFVPDMHSFYTFGKADVGDMPQALTTRLDDAKLSPQQSPILDVLETISLASASEALELDEKATADPTLPVAVPTTALLSLSSSSSSSSAAAAAAAAAEIIANENIYRSNATIGGGGVGGGGGALALTMPTFTGNACMRPLVGGTGIMANKSPLPAFEYISPTGCHSSQNSGAANITAIGVGGGGGDFPPLIELNGLSMFPPSFLHRRPRGEKRPIPEEQKDHKYYERRKRNNEAAKKSRDARKIREDRIAFRAAILEQENAILRAQVLALRDELHTMRELIGRNVVGPPI